MGGASAGWQRRAGNLVEPGHVVGHSFIVGELACGNLRNRSEILRLLQALPMAVHAEHNEVMGLIETRSLMGRGLGYIDMHLLASAILTEIPLWTLDRKLDEAASKLGRNYRFSCS